MSETPSDHTRDRDATRERADEHRTDRDYLNTDAMQWVSALAALLGLWLVASPFLMEATETAIWNNTMVGTAIFLVAGYNFYRMTRDRLASVGAAALVVLLGLWMAVTPYVIDMGSDELATSTTVTGVLIALLAAYNAYANSSADAPERAAARERRA